jgi:Ca-activated chloride channel homolog
LKFDTNNELKMVFKNILALTVYLFIGFALPAQSAEKLIREGFEAFSQGQFSDAAKAFEEAAIKSPENYKAYFNHGDALYEMDSTQLASRIFEAALNRAESKEEKAKVYHNIGNVFLKEKNYAKSIEAFKQSLLLNPKDEETRYNLAYAQMMQKQQQSNQDQKDDKDKQKDDQKKEQEKQENKNKDENKDQKKDEQNQQDRKNEKEQKEQQQGEEKQQNQISQKQAEMILKALEAEEKKVQEKQNRKKYKAKVRKNEKDW